MDGIHIPHKCSFEGESLLYPFNIWKHSYGYFCERGEPLHRYANIFYDVFFPYLQKEVLNVTMGIPELFKNIPDSRISRDRIRTDICDMLGVLDIPMPRSFYNINFTPQLMN